MPETPKKPVDPEMSAASKAKAARQPRQAGGKFASTTNAQEQRVLDLAAAVQAKERQIADLVAQIVANEDELRLLKIGNKSLISDNQRLTEERNSTVRELHIERIKIGNLADTNNTLRAEIEALQGANGNLTHDRDAMEQEVDRLAGLLTEALKAQETALGQEEAYRARWAREHQSKVISQVVSLIACVLASGIVLAVVMGGGK